jgi:hypothetical protein
VLSGHEHNFQYAVVNGIHARGEAAPGRPGAGWIA